MTNPCDAKRTISQKGIRRYSFFKGIVFSLLITFQLTLYFNPRLTAQLSEISLCGDRCNAFTEWVIRVGGSPIERGVEFVRTIGKPSVLELPELPERLALSGNQRETILGTVVDATTGEPISMALVCIQNGNQCVRTDEGGNYILHDVTATQHTLEVTASQYFFVEKPISVEPGENVTQHFALSPPLEEGDLRIVLTWGETPTDLDSHLHLQAGEESYLINYNEKGAKELLPFAILDVDDLDSFGPETITIQELVDGTYIYAVHNYSGDDTFLNADIRVEVYNDTDMVVEFTPTGEQNGRWWHVFDMNGELGTAVITEVNQIQDEMPEELSR